MVVRIHYVDDAQKAGSFQAVERKGLGHPDSIADFIADEFSRLYSRHCLERFGLILNHWVDKVNVVGSISSVRWGGFDITKPITVYLFGKITTCVGSDLIDLDCLLAEAASTILEQATHTLSITKHLRLVVENTAGLQLDHASAFYWPADTNAAARALSQETVANDTVICSAYARSDDIADTAIAIEQMLTDKDSLTDLRGIIGTDVKVCLLLAGGQLTGTICIPVQPDRVGSRSAYDEIIDEVRHRLLSYLDDVWAHRFRAIQMKINTKDTHNSAYLAPFGTALGKGDCGVVGRGNRINGVINALEPASTEAPAGKNPMHHVGKLYTIGAQMIASALVARGSTQARVLLCADNGQKLDTPASICIDALPRPLPSEVNSVVSEVLSFLPSYWKVFVNTSPVKVFKEGVVRSMSEQACS